MPRGVKPLAPGAAKRPEQQVHGWTPATSTGWQHGDIPEPPDGLMPASLAMWNDWFTAWYASFWQPDAAGMIRQIIAMYDQMERGDLAIVTKMTPLLHAYGITPKGRQDLRWAPPVGETDDGAADLADQLAARREARRGRLQTGSG